MRCHLLWPVNLSGPAGLTDRLSEVPTPESSFALLVLTGLLVCPGVFLCTWLTLVGPRMAHNWISMAPFPLNTGDRRLTTVDQRAAVLRSSARVRRIGQVAIGVGAIGAVAAVVALVRLDLVALVILGAIATGAVAVGLMLGRTNDPLVAVWWRRHRPTGQVRTARGGAARLVSYGISAGLLVMVVLTPPLMLLLIVAGVPQFAAAGVLIVAFVGYTLDYLARRLRTAEIQRRSAAQGRDRIVYLRNFGDDQQKIPTTALSRTGAWQVFTTAIDPMRRSRFEELLARALWTRKAVYGLQDPDVALTTLGVVKTRAPQGKPREGQNDDTWKDEVRDLARDAWGVVVSATPTNLNEGLRWELDYLARDLPHGRIMLVLGPENRESVGFWFRRFLTHVGQYPLFFPLTSGWVSDATLVLVHVPSEGRGAWYGWQATRRTPWAYAAAIDAALTFAESRWAEPPAELAALDGPQVSQTVRIAATRAVAEAAGGVVDTGRLLQAVMAADTLGHWERIALESDGTGGSDPVIDEVGHWHGIPFTGSAGRALRIAYRVAVRYDLRPMPPGVLALGLVADRRSSASVALGATDPDRHARLLRLIQDDLIGADLEDLDLGHDGDVSRFAIETAEAERAEHDAARLRAPKGSRGPSLSEIARRGIAAGDVTLRLPTVVITTLIAGFAVFASLGPLSDPTANRWALAAAPAAELVLLQGILRLVAISTRSPRYVTKVMIVGTLTAVIATLLGGLVVTDW